jgi:hypothetical protein
MTEKRSFLAALLFTLLGFSVFAGNIDKAFGALKVFNYFEAKERFTKALKKSPSPASYGLAVIYFRTDNPFSNLDSAFASIIRSEAAYARQKEKTREKLKKHGFDYLQIVELRNRISDRYYAIALADPSELAFDRYQAAHPWSQNRFQAVYKRDSIAFSKAADLGTSAAFADFMRKYPDSEMQQRANGEFYRLQYAEQTAAGTLASYIGFQKAFPSNPYAGDAQDQVYRISTAPNTIPALESFLQAYPDNRNRDDAWRRLYQLFMYDYSPQRVDEFRSAYPQYPFMSELERDKQLAGEIILPYKDGAKFGWMDLDGKPVIEAQYEAVGFFREGIAWAQKNGRYGYVNKENNTVIDFRFSDAMDFEKGRAIVSVDDKFGITDRSGMMIFQPEYEDIGQFSEQLIYAAKDSLYGYFDTYGYPRIEPRFTEAFSFSKGMARVKVGELDAFIDVYGNYIVPPVYEEIEFFSDSLLTFAEGDFYGLMNRKAQIVVPAVYDQIYPLINDRALFIKDEKAGYMNSRGQEVIPAQFAPYATIAEDGTFKGPFAKVSKADKFGMIDKAGKLIVPAVHRVMGRPGTTIAIEQKGKWGYMDVNSKILIAPAYEYAETFENGLGIVQQLMLKGAINPKGAVVIPLQHTEVKRLDAKHYLVSIGAKYGMYSDVGQLIVPLEYGQIRKIQDDLYLLTKGGDVHYLYVPENKLIQPKL